VPTPDPPNATPVQRVRIPLKAWLAFGACCRRNGAQRSRQLFDLMWGYVRKHGTDEEKSAFAEADRELRAKRSRKPPPPGA
jgi:hypothetical protein